VVRLNRAVATRFAISPQAALAEVEALAAELDGYRLYHAVGPNCSATSAAVNRPAPRTSGRSRWPPTRPNASCSPAACRCDATRHTESHSYCIMTGLISITIQPRSTPGQVLAISAASSIEPVSSSV
jgi:hypothetical protein